MVNASAYKTDFDELVFAFKNKEYGSYKLRKSYKTYLSTAMWIAILLFILAATGSTIYKKIHPSVENIKPKDSKVIILDQPPLIEQMNKEVMVELQPRISTIKYTSPVVKADELVHNETIPTIDELKNANPDNETVEGVNGGIDQTLIENENIIIKEKEVVKEQIYIPYADILPTPIDGLDGIQKKIIYPEIAKKAEVEGKVIIRAFVDETGTVTKAEILKGIGVGCDEAALNAVLKTKFNPGKQRGNPVKVQVSIPIIFKLQ